MADLRAQLEEGLASRYTIGRELGRGGMATVYLAHDLRHDRDVALKVLHPELALALGPERFQREIRLAARLQHPHILTVLDSGEVRSREGREGLEGRDADISDPSTRSTFSTPSTLYFTMPYVEGRSLRDTLTHEKQLSVDEALRIAREAAQALQYAHDHGVIHRDIKPENILLTQDGSTLVADFGIARSLATGDEKLTETGMSIGTPAYMSPEQASGEHDLTARTDIYSLGAVLYEMLVGEPPFTGVTPQAILAKRFSGEAPDVRRARSSIPESVAAAITRALAMVPADRWPSAAEFSRALSVQASSTTTPVPPVLPVLPAPRRRISPAFAALAVGFLLGIGVLFAWSRNRAAGGADTPLIAVLPFENAGDSADAYFADGMAEEVRGRLAKLSGLRVVASGSTREYRQTTKTLPQIGRELGAQYLLTATVRWAKAADGTSRVRVSPELVRIGDGTATTEWQQPFDASLTDVFQVQADISERVARELNLALGAEQHEQLSERPTKSLAAYDLYLRARSIDANDVPTLRRMAALYQQAVEADSEFVEAWQRLSSALSLLYTNGTPDPAVRDRARQAAERALALDPNGPHGHAAMVAYHRLVSLDLDAAERSMQKALAAAPNDAALLRAAGLLAQARGDYDGALAKHRAARRLDPRSVRHLHALATVFLWLRRYPEALAASDSSLALGPGNLSVVHGRAMIFAAQGDLARAREALRLVSPSNTPMEVAAHFGWTWDMYWVLDEAGQQLLTTSRPSDHPDREAWAVVLMQLYAVRGDTGRARAYADTALLANADIMRGAPDDPQRFAFRGLELGHLGRRAEAIAAAERSMSLSRRDAGNDDIDPYYQQIAARTYLALGDQERALDLLEPLLKIPYYLSPGWLRIDPSFAALRGNPRFQRMIAGT